MSSTAITVTAKANEATTGDHLAGRETGSSMIRRRIALQT
jgi:hypothetical protein